MSEPYAHITFGESRNAERLGAFVAWLVTNNLLESVFERTVDNAVARLKMQDMSGPEFLTTVLHGELSPRHLCTEGREFVETYFVSGAFEADYAQCEYKGDNDWVLFDELSPRISAAYRKDEAQVKVETPLQGTRARRTAKIISFPFGRK